MDEPVALGRAPGERSDPESLWWRHETLHRAVLRDPERLLPLFAKERDALEASWLAETPASHGAFAEGDRCLAAWRERVADAAGPDRRPLHARRFWRSRDERAGLARPATARA